jgi:D-sedoheptulose 7-phosphate isomerase
MIKNLRYVLMGMLVMFGMSAMAEDIIWQEDWSEVTDFTMNPNIFKSNYTFTGSVLKEDGTVKSGTKFYNESMAGGTAPELLIAKNGGSFMVSILLNGKSGNMTLTYKCNKSITVEEITQKDQMVSEATSIGNDYGYSKVFSRQIQANGVRGDVFIGISTSGNSQNLVESLDMCRKIGITTVALVGSNPSKMDGWDYVVKIPSSVTPRIQECQTLIGHIICCIVEENLFGGK